MSRFRTFIESFAKNVYVEGLSLEESQLVTFIESCERLHLKEDALTDEYRDLYTKYNQKNPKPLPLSKVVSFAEELDKAIVEHSIEKYKITPRIIKRSATKPGSSKDSLVSFYGYAVFDIPVTLLGVSIEDKLPIEIVYRISDHGKPGNQADNKNDDIDVQVPAEKYEKDPYARRVKGNSSQYPYEFLFTDKKKDKKTGEYICTYDFCQDYINTALKMLDAAYSQRFSDYATLLGQTRDDAEDAYEKNGKVSSEDIVIHSRQTSDGEIRHRSSTPLGDEWFANLKNILENNIDTINQHLFEKQQKKQAKAQDKAASFQQATQKTTALAKMAQAQKDIDTVVPSPDKER